MFLTLHEEQEESGIIVPEDDRSYRLISYQKGIIPQEEGTQKESFLLSFFQFQLEHRMNPFQYFLEFL